MSFRAEVLPIPTALHAEMMGASWRADPRCPSWAELALLRMSHWGFDGALHDGELVVAAAVADDVVRAFSRIFEARFPIERMVRIDVHGGDDDRSMAANNCSGFNFRTIATDESTGSPNRSFYLAARTFATDHADALATLGDALAETDIWADTQPGAFR